MPTTDIPLLCRIVLEDGRGGETMLDTAQRVCRENYGDQADAVFASLLEAVQRQLQAGAAGPDAAITALAETEPPPPPPARRPWWRIW
jgi:hypothetical protein